MRLTGSDLVQAPAPTSAVVAEGAEGPSLIGRAVLQRKMHQRALQRRATTDGTATDVHQAAEQGIAGAGTTLPHRDAIQQAFGKHDVSGIVAHTGPEAEAASASIGAAAYATKHHVAFLGAPSLHTAAHEAAHVVQQRDGVSLSGGVGEEGDPYERHADAVADAVVAGRSAETLLDTRPTGSGNSGRVQRQTLKQANKADGLTDTNNKLAIAGKDGWDGLVYAITLDEEAQDRTDALNKAAATNAAVGQRIEGMGWNGSKDQCGQAKFKELDPFFLEVTVKFQHDSSTETLKLVYQHAKQANGYVVRVEDSSNSALQGEQKMDIPKKKNDSLREGFTYSNSHDQSDTGNIAALTKGGEEKNIDAYTKIAGEGARWKCVRNHAAKLKNGSRFFTANQKDETGNTVFAIAFEVLWKNWLTGFSSKYNIDDSQVALALAPGGTLEGARGEAVAKTDLTADDYDLDKGAGHVVG